MLRGVPLLKNPFTFDERGFQFQEGQGGGGVPIWLTPNGDKLALYHFEMPPDIEADLADKGGLRVFYRAIAHRAGLGVLETETIVVDGHLAVRTLFKMAQGRHGLTYIGALTFPFRDFSYVFRVESSELGVTGIRETYVTAKLLSTQKMPEVFPSGWLDDPYDSNESGPMTRNISERPEYDSLFPDHPLSRARHVLDHLHHSITIDNSVKKLPKFTFDQNPSRHHRT